MPVPVAVSLFSCAFSGFMLAVQGPPGFIYSVSSAATGAAWLEGGGLSIFDGSSGSSGAWLSPGAGLVAPGAPTLGVGEDSQLGTYSFLSVDWASNSSALKFTANFTCYKVFSMASFSLTFADGATLGGGLPGASALPTTRFPSFDANSKAAVRSTEMGFVEWAGEMSEYGNKHGVGLANFEGGRDSGPLLLFNKSELHLGGPKTPAALVIGQGAGPGTHLVHTVIKIVPGASAVPPTAASSVSSSYDVDPSCVVAAHTDKQGGSNAPGSGTGLVVQQGNASACCAACRALGASACDSYVYDTNGFAADGHNCWPILGLTGSTPRVVDRVLGLNGAVRCAPQASTAATGSVPVPGFEAGQQASTPDACCVICATLGAASCVAWQHDAASGLCTPLSAYAGTASAPAAQTFGVAQTPPAQLSAGVQGLAVALPPRFCVSVWLAGSQSGLSDAMMHYGEALRSAADLRRVPRDLDATRNLLSYWSDNGAFYYDGYWPKFFDAATNTAQQVFQQLKAYHAALGLTIGAYQMDPWWYGGSCGADGPPPPQCHVAAAWPWSANFSAAPGFFPDGGLAAVGLPLLLYSNLYAQASNGNAMTTRFAWMNDSCAGIAPCAIVVPEQSYDFHSWIFDVGAAMGQVAFEIDFADYIFPFSLFAQDVRAFDAYFAGVDRAASEHAFPVQLCMSLPLMMLDSVFWPSVTNARLQGDGYVTNGGRYDIFQTSLLYSAVAIAPFVDNVWTTGCQPAWDNAYGNATCETHSEGLIAIATLGAGPVGIGDRVGFTNASLVNMTCRADGVLLQPALPAVNVEAFYADELPPGGARITSAPSFVPLGAGAAPLPAYNYPLPAPSAAALFLTVFGTFVAAPVALAPVDLWPLLPPPGTGGAGGAVAGYYVQALSRRALCVDGAPAVASGCANFSTGADVAAPLVTVLTGSDGHELFSVAPAIAAPGASGAAAAGWALLGEISKFTRVSAARVTSLDASADCALAARAPMCVTLVGAAGERVQMALVDPLGTVRLVETSLGPTGKGALACTCDEAVGSCSCA